MYATNNCPKCGKPNTIMLTHALDELGEVYRCPHCGWKYRIDNG